MDPITFSSEIPHIPVYLIRRVIDRFTASVRDLAKPVSSRCCCVVGSTAGNVRCWYKRGLILTNERRGIRCRQRTETEQQNSPAHSCGCSENSRVTVLAQRKGSRNCNSTYTEVLVRELACSLRYKAGWQFNLPLLLPMNQEERCQRRVLL